METKQEISQIVDTLPEQVLNDLLRYLKELEKISQDKNRLSINLNTILLEDHELLDKLSK